MFGVYFITEELEKIEHIGYNSLAIGSDEDGNICIYIEDVRIIELSPENFFKSEGDLKEYIRENKKTTLQFDLDRIAKDIDKLNKIYKNKKQTLERIKNDN